MGLCGYVALMLNKFKNIPESSSAGTLNTEDADRQTKTENTEDADRQTKTDSRSPADENGFAGRELGRFQT